MAKTLLLQNLNQILNDLNVKGLDDREKQEVANQLIEHFNRLIMETIVANLNDQQIAEFNQALDESDDKMQEKITAITAQVPGLAKKIETAVENEVALLKAAKQKVG